MLKHHNYKNMSFQQIFESFSHYQQVSFAFYCAKEVESFTNDQRIIACNNAVERWLKGDQTVDLELARNNVWNAWSNTYAAAASARAAASAATAANAVYAVDTAYSAAYYAVSAAAYAAANVADAKSYNLYPNNNDQREIAYNQFYNEYNQIAQNWLSLWEIPNFPKDESDFPIFDFLQDYNLISYLLPKKRKYYHLNLNGFKIKHHNEAELLKLIDTTHIKKIIMRIINNDLS